MISDGKTHNIKVVDLEKLWNFVVQNFLIWNNLRPQIVILIQAKYRITKLVT